MNQKNVAERYIAAMRARNVDELMTLYAEDATFVLPDGREFHGLVAIRGMHESVIKAAAPMPNPKTSVVGDNAIAVEIEAQMPDGKFRRTVNFYHLNSQGRIRRLSVYMQAG